MQAHMGGHREQLLNGHEVVNLSFLPKATRPFGDDLAAQEGHAALARNLMEKGWCFVRLPSHMLLNEKQAGQLRAFFETNDTGTKAAFAERQGYGYSAVAEHKEAYRMLTGRRLLKRQPKELDAWLSQFVGEFDAGIMHLLLQIAEPVFEKKPNEVARIAELPVSYMRSHHFGMLDFARYRNDRVPAQQLVGDGASVDEVNCVPHYDPGLLSISFFSDQQGLQLKAPIYNDKGELTGEQWVDGPVNTVFGQEELGVLWLGEAAVRVNESLRAGIHRVVYPSASEQKNRARLTGWYEVCTTDQALGPNEDAQFESGSEVAIPNISAKENSGMVKVPMKPGERESDFLAKVERTYGIPPTKVMHLHYKFKTWQEGVRW